MKINTFSLLPKVIVSLFLLLLSTSALAIDPVYTGGSARAAIKGYDTVAYFTEGKAVKGSSQYSAEYQGATWHFASEENQQLFIASPEKYAPQYGGYCAYAVSRNSTASIKPEYFTVHQGKLYLNYNRAVYKRWQKDKRGHINKANKNWPDLLEE